MVKRHSVKLLQQLFYYWQRNTKFKWKILECELVEHCDAANPEPAPGFLPCISFGWSHIYCIKSTEGGADWVMNNHVLHGSRDQWILFHEEKLHLAWPLPPRLSEKTYQSHHTWHHHRDSKQRGGKNPFLSASAYGPTILSLQNLFLVKSSRISNSRYLYWLH